MLTLQTNKKLLAIAGALSGALVWGLIWYPYRVLYEIGVSGPLATLLSYLLAALFGAFLFPKVMRELPQFDRWVLLLIFSTGWTNFGYVMAVLDGRIIVVLLLFFLAPLWTILFSYFLLTEKLNRYGYLVIASSFSGAVIMLWEPSAGPPVPNNTAEWMGLSAGFCFALANVVSRRAQHVSIATKSFSIWVGTALLTAPLLLWQGNLPGQISDISAFGWLMLLLLGISLCAVSFTVQYGVTHLPANQASMLFLLELIIAAISAYFLAQESITLREWIGATLIVSASLLSNKMYDPRMIQSPHSNPKE